MAQGRSSKIISMIKWIWTIRLSIKNSLSVHTAGCERFLGQVNLLAINADGGGGILDSECPTGRAGNLPDGAHTPPEDPTRVN